MNTVTGRPAATDRPTARSGAETRWNLLRHRGRVDGVGAPVLGAAFWLAVMVLVALVSIRVEIRVSGWEVATQIVRWFVGAIGVYLTALYLPLYVAHGCTRRDAARQLGVFGVLYALLVAALVVLGFVLERLVYAVAGWPQSVEATRWAADAAAYPGLLAQYGLLLPVWMAGGALLGAAFYRSGALGTVLLVPTVAIVFLTEWTFGVGERGWTTVPFLDAATASPPAYASLVTAAIALGGATSMVVGTWLVVRDVPLRTEAA